VITCASEDMNSILAPVAPVESVGNPLLYDEGSLAPEPVQRAQDTSAPNIRIRTRKRIKNQRARDWIYLTGQFLPAHPNRYANLLSNIGGESEQVAEVENDDIAAVESDYSPLSVRQRVLRYLEKGDRTPIETPSQLASIITQLSMSVFDHHEIPAEVQFFDFFEQSIGEVVSYHDSS
jgi:hypothetical protein